MVDLQALPENPLQEVPMQLKGQAGHHLLIYMGNNMFVVNKCDQHLMTLVGRLPVRLWQRQVRSQHQWEFQP